MSLTSALSWLKAEPGRLHAWLTGHGQQLNTAIEVAKTVGTDAAAGAAITGHADVAAAINRSIGGLTVLQSTITAETGATTLAAAASAVTALATDPAFDLAIGVKSDATKADITTHVAQINGIAGILSAAATTAAAIAATPAVAPGA